MAHQKKYFSEVDTRVSFPKLEEKILAFWEKEKIFEKSLEKTKKGKEYVFYDGPPTANGKPHAGHVITRTFKDVFPRYKTMQGYHSVRKAGWDTHGLPVEVAVEKELGISGKDQIENIVKGDSFNSIKQFNEKCKESVWKYVDLWEKMVKRVGHWIDLDHPYVTYDNSYIESVWWSLSELFKRGDLYLGYKVVPYCTRCETPLSSHELAQDYKEVEDPSVFVKFPLAGSKNTAFLAWTTTPWTLPGNVALAVDPKMTYVEVKNKEGTFILGEAAYERLKIGGTVQKKVKGSTLVGKKYLPPFAYLSMKYKGNKKLHTVLEANFIEKDDGTGIVHTAVMYGEEDFKLGKENGLPMHHLVDAKGKFIKEVAEFSGLHVKDADEKIIATLSQKGLLFKKVTVKHKYPFCWRCHNPLIYYALDSWFIKTTKYKKELIKNNSLTNWVPGHVGRGRMKNWYETLIDWSLSRNRYWGAPLPIWRCTDKKCDTKVAISSLSELKEKAIGKTDWQKFDLHRPFVDAVQISCPTCGKVMQRVEEVIDVWYESGSMPFAQWGAPLKGEAEFKKYYPADFISEAIDQTRGWFFSLQAVSTLLFGKTPYKNVVVFEHALDEKGKKMSKHIGNVLDPWEAFEKHGADASRWFFLSSVSVGTQYRVSVDTIGEAVRGYILPLWNIYNFFVTYANLDGWSPPKNQKIDFSALDVLDKWILVTLDKLTETVTAGMEAYDPYKATNSLQDFVVKDFSQWYVRRSRERFGPTSSLSDKKKASAYLVYWTALKTVLELSAPMVPFTTEAMYKNLTKADSVHLANWPKINGWAKGDSELLSSMALIREIVEKAHAIRKEKNIAVRQPLQSVTVKCSTKKLSEDFLSILKSEINVLGVEWQKGEKTAVSLDTELSSELIDMGKAREVVRDIQMARRKAGTKIDEVVGVILPSWPKSQEEEIKRNTLVSSIKKGESIKIIREKDQKK